MQIRKATRDDQIAIINVLKASLGETSSKKNSEVWSFKHIENPFGKSLVLVAEEDNNIIGVRAFMKWKWIYQGREFLSYRAVDTATHPSHQGKGIFKKLTLAAMEIAQKEEGGSFIFNTPNANSKPGYLKMGWEIVDNIIITLKPSFNPINWISGNPEFKYSSGIENPKLQALLEAHDNLKSDDQIYTPKNVDYLKWRYINNPLQKYLFKAGDAFCVIGYIKQQKLFKELRIVEMIFTDKNGEFECLKWIKSWAKSTGAHFISLSGSKSKISGKWGPELTFKSLNISSDHQKSFLDITKWDYSLGDLELF